MPTCLDAARLVMSKGMRPVPLLGGTKRPLNESWPTYNAEPWTLERDFTADRNIGVILGDFVDIDLDSPEAIALATVFLPPTPMKHGRTRAPNSHWWYRIEGTPVATRQFRDEKGMLVEFRGLGGQTMIPWSKHPDTAEVLEWVVPNPGTLPDLVPVSTDALMASVCELAAATVIARHWPADGLRHHTALALGGVLGRAGWPVERVRRFVAAVCQAAGDEDTKDRVRAGADTVENLAKGKPRVTGIPTLVKSLGQGTVDRLLEWLGISADKPEPPPEPPADTLAGADAAIRAGEDPRPILRRVCQRILADELSELLAKPMLSAASGRPEFEEMWRVAMDEARLLPVVPTLDKKDPRGSAIKFLHTYHRSVEDDLRLLHHYRGEFYRWDGAAYRYIAEPTVRADLWKFCPEGRVVPTSSIISNMMDALKGLTHTVPTIEPPYWMTDRPAEYPVPEQIIPCKNGFYHPGSDRLLPSTPRLFTTYALPFDYNPEDARPPSVWNGFLKSLWPEDQQSIDTLQEIFGYLLTPDLSFHKMFMLIGPTRSGKGTISRVLHQLLGRENVEATSLSDLAMPFGLDSLRGKTCAIVSDARVSGKTDTARVTEILLNISGEDPVNINRKFLGNISVTLRTRVVIMSNELPRLIDTSNAFSGRFVMLHMTKTFKKNPDYTLGARLVPELAQILHWALEGRRRLYERGEFIVPEASAEIAEELESQSSPIGSFVRERCEVAEGRSVFAHDLYDLYLAWCRDNGKDHPMEASIFGRDLRTVVPTLSRKRQRDGARLVSVYQGIGVGNGEDLLPD